jgi:hypothetical protein
MIHRLDFTDTRGSISIKFSFTFYEYRDGFVVTGGTLSSAGQKFSIEPAYYNYYASGFKERFREKVLADEIELRAKERIHAAQHNLRKINRLARVEV